MKSNLQKIRSKFILSAEIITSYIKRFFFQSAWLQDSQTFITYTMQFLFYFQKSSFMLVTVACQISFSSGWPARALKPGSSTLAWPMKTPHWLLMPSWKEHRNSSYDHYYMILMSLSTLSNKTFGFLILYISILPVSKIFLENNLWCFEMVSQHKDTYLVVHKYKYSFLHCH